MTIAVGMSGGVDSSVAAFLLQLVGYDVVGFTLKLFDEFDANPAKDICERLEIPLHIIDLRDKFNETVIHNFCSEYSIGRTPNPCVLCNYTIKFDALYQYAEKMGVEKMATGHYVNADYDEESDRFKLIRGAHRRKEQSYFLWRLTQEQLSRTLFPLGNLKKDLIRTIAEKQDFPCANRKESQEVCFIKDGDLESYLKSHVDYQPGEILDMNGNVVGEHRGAIFYTIGQRKGLGVALGRPVYVIKIDAEKNQIVLGDNEHLMKRELTVNHTNWIAIKNLDEKRRVIAKIRYRHPGAKATIQPIDSHRVSVIFDEPQRAITPGQSAVFYEGEEVIGGGIIE
jgi:tRNA-specific 2-thiouridylase